MEFNISVLDINNVIIQWGRSSNVRVRNNITVTLPRAFRGTNTYKIVTTWFAPTAYQDVDDNPNVTGQNAGNFIVRASERGSHDSYQMPFNWISIGY